MTEAQREYDQHCDCIHRVCNTRDGLTCHGAHLQMHADAAIQAVLLLPESEQTRESYLRALGQDEDGCVCQEAS
jgi:hypothetical protein